jgi:uncharacterized oxidoreductase
VPRRVDHRALHDVARAIVVATGSEEGEAELVAAHLVGADLRGHPSHGVARLPWYVKAIGSGLLVPNTPARVLDDTGTILRLSGDRGYGQRVGHEATELAVARARRDGLCCLTLSDVHHLGRLGTYGEQAVAAGMVLIAFVNAVDHTPPVAPHGGIETRLSTNPLCIAFPGGDARPPTVVDFATSAVAMGKVRVAALNGFALPEGAVLDSEGRATTDPNVMLSAPRGALLPVGGHKGYGLMLACELLAGLLAGGGTIQPAHERHESFINGLLAFVVDPTRFADPAWLRQEVDAIVDYVVSSRPRHADQPVLQPGDPERLALARYLTEGVPLDDAEWQQLVDCGTSVGVDVALAIG